jgi:hypothetical protein
MRRLWRVALHVDEHAVAERAVERAPQVRQRARSL